MKTIALILAGLAPHLIAGETPAEREARIDFQHRIEIEDQRFRERQFHDEIVKQQERIHRDNVWQRERIAAEQREHLERIERAIPRYPVYTPRFAYFHGQGRRP